MWPVSGMIVFQTGPSGFSVLGLLSPVSHDFPVPGAMFDAAPLLSRWLLIGSVSAAAYINSISAPAVERPPSSRLSQLLNVPYPWS